jgi:hypothetical protein
MILWNTTALVESLARDEVTERDKMLCWLFLTVYYSLTVQNALWSCEKADALGVAKGLSVLTVNVVGVILCWKANREADDSAFLERFVCLSCPILFRIALALFVGGGLITLAAHDWNGLSSAVEAGAAAVPPSWELFFLTVGLEITYYLWLRSKFIAIGRLRERINQGPRRVPGA